MNRWSERVLVRRILADDHEACVQLVRLHYAPIYRMLVHLCRDAHLAEDLTQETFTTAWTHIAGFGGHGSVRTWLHRIAYNKFVDMRRRENKYRGIHEQLARTQADCPPGGGLAGLVAAESGETLSRAIAELPEAERVCVILHYLQDMSYQEMADVLDQPTGTIKWRVNKALCRLRRMLGENDEQRT